VDFFTHLFLETALLWVLFGAFHLQGEFLSGAARRASFWLVMLGTVAPDFDVLVVPAAHRLFTHSLVFPLIALLVGVALWAAHRRRITYTISWAIAFGLVAHLLLDLEGHAPLGLFWPLSPLCFAIRLAVSEGGGGMPQVQLVVLVYTVQDWLAGGGFVFESGLYAVQFGIPLLALLLFLASVGRDFWPWWPCCARQKRSDRARQG
jgi:membrane-bound metal-dependent hydrolase YbcI (DUF457 family)